MRHRLRRAGHECDRFVVRGIECPFRSMEDDDDEEERERELPEEEEREKVLEFPQEREFPKMMVPARRRPSLKIQKILDAVSKVELEKALERVGDIQDTGGLQFIPTKEQLLRALNSPTAQGLTAVLTALATAAAMSRGAGMRLSPQSLRVAASERQVAGQLSTPLSEFQGRNRRGIRKLFGFGPSAGFDSFSETGFN